MEYAGVLWRLPQQGFIKINVHGFYSNEPLPNGNRSGIGIVFRNDRGIITRMMAGSLGIQDERLNEFYAMQFALKRAFYEAIEAVELESDHVVAMWEWDNSRLEGAIPELRYIIQQLNIRKGDPNLQLIPRPIDEDNNRLAIYLAEVGAQNWNQMVIIAAPFGRIREIWSNDLGLGPVGLQFVEVHDDLIPVVEHEEAEVMLQDYIV